MRCIHRIGGEPGSYLCTWITETLRSLLPRIEQFGLVRANELDLDTLVARMEMPQRSDAEQATE